MKEIWLNCRMGEENGMSSKNICNPSFLIDQAQASKVLGFSLKSNLDSVCSGSHEMHACETIQGHFDTETSYVLAVCMVNTSH